MPVLKIKDEKGNWIKLPYVIKIIQKGDITEQSFDVFTVNRAERKIYATKIGAGTDREISY